MPRHLPLRATKLLLQFINIQLQWHFGQMKKKRKIPTYKTNYQNKQPKIWASQVDRVHECNDCIVMLWHDLKKLLRAKLVRESASLDPFMKSLGCLAFLLFFFLLSFRNSIFISGKQNVYCYAWHSRPF